ncbi:hypothetical protein [Bacillus sp. KH172YL63]|uniref:hypothetical protein n=1 Tax=Bacillus sp. KH172YL63 TaxID=2709784 RepID=UPI0013E5015C|nr:hypothetical protein [Bacillus sp. KH172YL63]BCB05156.1 hypothetical protein KH172YL63_32890 [Bacillus sp. KH172YL63]
MINVADPVAISKAVQSVISLGVWVPVVPLNRSAAKGDLATLGSPDREKGGEYLVEKCGEGEILEGVTEAFANHERASGPTI